MRGFRAETRGDDVREFARRWLPGRIPPLAEMYFWLVAAFAFFVVAIFFVTLQDWRMALPIAVGLLGFTAAGIGGTRVCLPLYFVTMFGNQFLILGLPVSLNQGFAALFFIAFFIDILRSRLRWNLCAALFFFLLFQVTYLANTIYMMPEKASWPIQPPFYILLTLSVMLLFWEGARLRLLLLSLSLISALLIVLPGAYELVTGNDLLQAGYYGLKGRINGLASNAILYSFTAIWALPFCALFLIESKSIYSRAFWFLTILAMTVMIFMTLNRQSPVILAGVVTVFVLLCRWRYKWWLLATMVAAGILLGQVFVLKAADRIDSAKRFSRDPSLTMRKDKLLIAWNIFKEFPVLGIGHNHFRYMWWENRPRAQTFMIQFQSEQEMYVDMGYMQILVEYGALGFLLFLATIGSAFWLWLRALGLSWGMKETWHVNLMAAIGAMFAQLLVSLLIQDTWITPHTFLLFGILFAASISVENAYRAEHSQELAASAG